MPRPSSIISYERAQEIVLDSTWELTYLRNQAADIAVVYAWYKRFVVIGRDSLKWLG